MTGNAEMQMQRGIASIRLVFVFISAAAALLFPAALVAVGARWYMNFPWAEDWAFCEIVLGPFCEGTLSGHDLLTPVNGYAKVSTWALRAPLAWATHWNHRAEFALNLLCGIGILAAISIPFFRRRRHPSACLLLPVLSAIVFGMDKSCIWFWGDGLTYVLSVGAAATGLTLLSNEDPSLARIAGAGVLGAVSLFAFAAGLPYLIAAGFLLLLLTPRPRLWRVLIGWTAWCALLAGLYWFVARNSIAAASESSWMDRGLLALRYVPVFLGAWLVKFHVKAAPIVGETGLLLSVFVLLRIKRDEWRQPQTMLFTAYMVFALLCGMGAAASREYDADSIRVMAYGSLLEGAALRHAFFAQFFWIGLLGHLWLRVDSGRKSATAFLTTYAAMLLVSCTLSGRTGYYEAQERYALYAPNVARIVQENRKTLPTRLEWPYGNPRREALRIMRKHRLSIFRPRAEAYWETYPIEEGKN